MIAINFTTARGRLKDFCDRVTDRGETVIVTRKAEKNVVIISEELMKLAGVRAVPVYNIDGYFMKEQQGGLDVA